MSLRRIDTTFDLPEAHIIVGLLRADGIDAYVFDADFVRQDWFKAIAYGGYRVMVADHDLQAARERIRAYREASTILSDADDPPCPACASSTYRDDPRPRRWVFALYMLLPLLQGAVLLFVKPSHVQHFFWFLVDLFVDMTLAMLAISYLKRRYVCDRCGHRWRDLRRFSYSALDRAHGGAFGPPG